MSGIITSAGASPVLLEEKEVAVRLVLNAPVYISSITFPRSNISFCKARQRYANGVPSLRCVQMMPDEVGSAVEVRQSSVSPR